MPDEMKFYIFRWVSYMATGIDSLFGVLTFGFWTPRLAIHWTLFAWSWYGGIALKEIK